MIGVGKETRERTRGDENLRIMMPGLPEIPHEMRLILVNMMVVSVLLLLIGVLWLLFGEDFLAGAGQGDAPYVVGSLLTVFGFFCILAGGFSLLLFLGLVYMKEEALRYGRRYYLFVFLGSLIMFAFNILFIPHAVLFLLVMILSVLCHSQLNRHSTLGFMESFHYRSADPQIRRKGPVHASQMADGYRAADQENVSKEAPVPEGMMVCAQCGTINRRGSGICRICGTELESESDK